MVDGIFDSHAHYDDDAFDADRDGLEKWLHNFTRKPEKVFVVHGDENVAPAFAQRICDQGYAACAPKMLDSYAGLTLPLMASATATFLFRQFFMTLPDELVEAARIDGASPMRFFCDIVFPLSKTNLAALFVITFIYGWNQYLWPLLIITDVDLGTTVAGIKGMIATGEGTTEWNSVMAAMLLTLIPPVVIVLVMQRAFVRGLVDSEK